ncbi:thymidylate kinase [Candidatus Woesearchaeota archaeon]|nr:thymidylate kinase [Candidatus Woesearchaeota archaeon]
MNKFIVLEGGDGVGKSTICEHLSERIEAMLIKTPGEIHSPIRSLVEGEAQPLAKFLYYLSSVKYASDLVAAVLRDGPVVCDRYIWSSLVGYSVYSQRGVWDIKREFQFIMDGLEIPNHTILLTVQEGEQLRRIYERNGEIMTGSDTLSYNQSSFRRMINNMYLEIAEREDWLVVDTSTKAIDDTLFEIMNVL